MNNDLEVSWPNAISFSVYYGFRVVGLFIFVLSLIPLSLIFSWVVPGFFSKLASIIGVFVDDECINLDRDWKRLARKPK
jgi:hypothetical protein